MKILILAREEDLTGVPGGYARGLRRAEVQLYCVPMGTPLDSDIRDLVARCPERPDFILHPDTDFSLFPGGLAKIEIPTVCFHSDPYSYTHRRVHWSNLFDHVVLNHPGFAERFRAAGNPRPLTLNHAVDASFFAGPEIERVFDVSSVGRSDGSIYRTRRGTLQKVSAKYRTNEWWRRHSYEEMAVVYRQSKIVLNVPRDDFPSDVSLRFAEAMAAGALFVTPQQNELGSLGFVEDEHFVTYRNEGELPEVLGRYLGDETERKCVAGAGREKAVREHSYDSRVKMLLEALVRDPGALHAPSRSWPEARVRRIYVDYFAANACLGLAFKEWRYVATRSASGAVTGGAQIVRMAVRLLQNRVRAAMAGSS